MSYSFSLFFLRAFDTINPIKNPANAPSIPIIMENPVFDPVTVPTSATEPLTASAESDNGKAELKSDCHIT